MITIIEPYHHSEVVHSIGLMLEYRQVPYKIVASSEVIQDCDDLDCEKIPITYFASNNAKVGICLFTTLTTCDLALLKSINADRSIAIIHNSNHYFRHKPNFVSILSIQNIKSLARQLLNNKRSLPLQILSLLDGFVTAEKWMLPKEYSHSKYIGTIPFTYADINANNHVSDTVNIGIPGTINNNARDYDLLYRAIKDLEPLASKVTFHFIGNSNTKQGVFWQKKLGTLASSMIQFKFEPEYVSIKKYDINLRNLDFMIVPCKESYPLGNVTEYYGQTNITGAYSDMIKYAIPSLWIDHYPLNESLENITDRFSDANDLRALIHTWVKERKFETFIPEQKAVLQEFGIESQSTKLLKVLS